MFQLGQQLLPLRKLFGKGPFAFLRFGFLLSLAGVEVLLHQAELPLVLVEGRQLIIQPHLATVQLVRPAAKVGSQLSRLDKQLGVIRREGTRRTRRVSCCKRSLIEAGHSASPP